MIDLNELQDAIASARERLQDAKSAVHATIDELKVAAVSHMQTQLPVYARRLATQHAETKGDLSAEKVRAIRESVDELVESTAESVEREVESARGRMKLPDSWGGSRSGATDDTDVAAATAATFTRALRIAGGGLGDLLEAEGVSIHIHSEFERRPNIFPEWTGVNVGWLLAAWTFNDRNAGAVLTKLNARLRDSYKCAADVGRAERALAKATAELAWDEPQPVPKPF